MTNRTDIYDRIDTIFDRLEVIVFIIVFAGLFACGTWIGVSAGYSVLASLGISTFATGLVAFALSVVRR